MTYNGRQAINQSKSSKRHNKSTRWHKRSQTMYDNDTVELYRAHQQQQQPGLNKQHVS